MKAKLRCATVLLCVATSSAKSATIYSLTALAPVSGINDSEAVGINDSGQVVGESSPSNDATSNAVIWNNTGPNVWTPSTLNGAPGLTYAGATRINNAGQAIGYASSPQISAVIWNGTATASTLSPLLPGSDTFVQGINDAGMAVGTSASTAVVWNANTPPVAPTIFNVPVGTTYSYATAINIVGQVAGGLYDSVNGNRAVTWNATTPVTPPTVLGEVAGSTGAGTNAINDAGVVVGSSYNEAANTSYAVKWMSGRTEPVVLNAVDGFTRSGAQAINNDGVVVGYSGTADFSFAVIWNGTAAIDLNTLLDASGAGWLLTIAWDINSNGQIVGYGSNLSGQIEGFLLNPYSQTPLPAALPLFAPGLSALGLLGWRRTRKAAAFAEAWSKTSN